MKKIWATLLAAALLVPTLPLNTANAARAISITINGSRLATDQAPVSVKGRVLLPLRAIFEALDASVDWNKWTQTVTASKNGTTVVLKMKSKTATINNEKVTLDVPAQAIKGRTMVPVRFISEALGEQVDWNSSSRVVSIVTSGGYENPEPDTLSPVSYVTLRDVGNAGDGRDLEVSFSRSSTESMVDHYRILIVKAANASRFTQNDAQRVSSSNYMTLRPNGTDPSVTLSSGARDVDGATIQNNQSYVAFVLAVGKGNAGSALSGESGRITLGTGESADAATNVSATDISDYGDGRDLSVSFTRPQNESNISNYRIYIVKTKDAGNFNLSTANGLSSQSYTTVNKTSTSNRTLSGTLSSSARDSSGDLIRNGISYTAFVLSVSNTGSLSDKLSSGSSSFVLGTGSVAAPVITKVEDLYDHGDGRDLRVSFTKVSDESRISGYRIFVVKNSSNWNFDLARANGVSSSNYTSVSKTGYNQNPSLSSSARDIDGDLIRTGVDYRVYVMAVGSGTNAGSNALSAASNTVKLLNNYSVGTVSNLSVSDVNDNNDGRDLLVSYTRASDESNISQYRIMVVKSSKAGSFTLSKANAVSSSNYTLAYPGSNFNSVLSSGARDTDGDRIQNGVSYRVFVLSVGRGSYSGTNTLSRESSAVTLGNNYSVGAVSGITVNDVSDYGDARDMRVNFNRASDESNIGHYRVFVVKASKAGRFDLSDANDVSSGRYTQVNKAGRVLDVPLTAWMSDVDGDAIRNGVSYRVYVLSVSNNNYGGNNALSSQNGEITLSDSSNAQGVSGLSAVAETANSTGTASDIKVSFTKAANENKIAEYRILVVPSAQAGGFDLRAANNVTVPGNYTSLAPNGRNVTGYPVQGANDVYGTPINANTTYQVFVLSVARSGSASSNGLSAASNQVKLNAAAPVPVPQVPNALSVVRAASDVAVSFAEPGNTANIAYYVVFAVPSGTPLNAGTALKSSGVRVEKGSPQTALSNDISGTALDTTRNAYDIYVLSVPADAAKGTPTLSGNLGATKVTPAP
ncbi:copper amine oxidase N-terminal domain-containing protein [Paenibacillus sanfengchensis]|uniref:copper amine oxidase N-terminal domain-containing protein n=1 Tax=Paenibacillus sanfengchensis TaxID=3119819 RepID=UPI002FE3B397